MEKRKGKIMGLLREFLDFTIIQEGNQSSVSECLSSYLYLTRQRSGRDISDELLDELAQLRFDFEKDICKKVFNCINNTRFINLSRKIAYGDYHEVTIVVVDSISNKYVSMLGDILEIGTFIGVKDLTTGKVKLAKGIFYAK